MNIQSGYGVFAYQGAGKVGSPDTSTRSALPDADTKPSSASDQVTISEAAKKMAAQEGSGATQAMTPAQERLLQAAASDPQSAEKLASDMAHASSTIFYDIRGMGGGQSLNKLSSGRIIDDSFKEKFASEASAIDTQRRAIYDSEKAKGTDPVQILSKMINFTNSQPADYLEASGWRG